MHWEKTLTCVKCKSDGNGNCATIEENVSPTKCQPFVQGYENYCFTHVQNDTITRGCILENEPLLQECSSWHTENCAECRSNNCNRYPIDTEYCYDCDSNSNLNCTSSMNTDMRKKCPLNLHRRGCYRIEDNDGELVEFFSIIFFYNPLYHILIGYEFIYEDTYVIGF